RARRAEAEAQQTRLMAEQARGQAEHLVAYLSDDFARELESFGRLDVLAEFSQRQIDYFHALPPALRGPESIRNAAQALVYHGSALRTLGNLDGASANVAEAMQILGHLRDGGDHSEATTIAMARADIIQSRIQNSRQDPAQLPTAQHAVELVRPIAAAPHASIAARRVYIEALIRRGFEQSIANQNDEAAGSEREAQRIAADLGAGDGSNPEMGAYYAEAAAWLVGALTSLGRNDEALRAGEDADAVADKVLERRPGYRLALHAQQVIDSALVGAAENQLNPAEAVRFGLRGEQVSLTLLKLDAGNIVSINNLGAAHQVIGDALWQAGRLREAVTYRLKSIEDMGRATAGGANFYVNRAGAMSSAAYFQAVSGDTAGAAATLTTAAPFLAQLRRSAPRARTAAIMADGWGQLGVSIVAYERGDLPGNARQTAELLSEWEALAPQDGFETGQRHFGLYFTLHDAGRTQYRLGNFAAAERMERRALEERKAGGTDALSDQRDMGELSTWIAMAEARQGHLAEAAETIAPVIRLQRGLALRNHGDAWLPQELAASLYAQALADPAHRAALLRESAGLIDGLTPQVRAVHDVQLWRGWIREAQGNSG
ncbi:MAG: hypothetical protein WAN26_10620, partial [Steroidobacteraceae bacterium]